MSNAIAATTDSPFFNVESIGSTPTLFLHCALFLPGKRIVSDETFRLQTFQGKEGVSTLFEFELELNGNSSQDSGERFSFDEVVGCQITVGIQYPYATGTQGVSFQQAIAGKASGPELVLFNGIVSSFAVKNRGQYHISMKPALHRLTLTNNYKVYSQKNICEVIEELLKAQHIAYVPFQLPSLNLARIRRQDWLQAGETDFEFLQRLMGKAHLYFYFTHAGNSHLVCFSNQALYPPIHTNREPLYYEFTGEDALGLAQGNVISEYCYTKTLSSACVSGTLTQQGTAWSHNHIVPYVSYRATSELPSRGSLAFNLYQSFQYGGSREEIKDIVDATQSTKASASSTLTGSSYCAHFSVAHTFTLLSGSTSSSLEQANLEREPFVLTMVSHNANADGSYQNQFQASSAHDLITPYSMQETQQGSLLAIVVNHSSTAEQTPTHFGAPSSFDAENNLFTDAMNSVPEFAQKGVYVRLSTEPSSSNPVWIKLSAAMQTVPTIGSIVQVSRAQDTSELPEIQNIIQTNGSMLVVPSGWLANTHVGSSYATNYGNSKSINYGAASNANLQQAISIIGAAYDSGRFDSVGFTQGTNYSFSCADNLAADAQRSTAELFGSLPVASDILSATESFGSTYSRQHANTTRNFSTVESSINISNAAFTTNIANTGITNNLTHSGMTHNETTSGETTNITTSGETTNITTTGLTFNTTISGLTKNITYSGDTWNTSTTGNLTEIIIEGDVTRTVTKGNSTVTTVNGIETENNVSGDVTKTNTCGNLSTMETAAAKEVTNTSISTTNTVTSGETTNTVSGGDTNNINTCGMISNITTTGETTTVETTGPGAKVSTHDTQPHVDNIVSRVTMVEATVVFM